MQAHRDVLGPLNGNNSLDEKLQFLHRYLGDKHGFIHRVAVAIYDPASDILRTYLDSTIAGSPLRHYEARLAGVPSLKAIVNEGVPRVINDMSSFGGRTSEHSRRLAEAAYLASYTLPIYDNGSFLGFIFFDARQKDCFTAAVLEDLDLIGHLISLTVARELIAVQTMSATLKTAHDIFSQRDMETGAHLMRMAQYAKIIAREIAEEYGLSDEFIEHLYLYAPLHDIGKIGIPDDVLLKPSRLSADEFSIMKQHVQKGREIVDSILENFGHDNFSHFEILQNIVELHHEAINGHGYIHGLIGDDIPIESRIIAVADVFDALTSSRPYKEAWSNERAFATLRSMAGTRLDGACVEALCRNPDQILQVQARYRELMPGRLAG